MRIGVDARELRHRPTGVGRYLGGLLTAWAAGPAATRHQFVLYAPASLPSPWTSAPFVARIVAGTGGTWWEQVALRQAASRDDLDVFFSPGYSVPLALAAPRVVAIHDVSFAAHPEWFRTREGLRRRILARQSAARAEAVITISRFSRDEILEHLAPGCRVHVIPPGIAPAQPGGDGRREERVLYVGSVFNRRHVPDLIRGFARVARRRPGAVLDLVGENVTYPYEDLSQVVLSEGLGDRVSWRPYVSEDELREAYAAARAFAFLSEYEGLGLTPLEALAAGVPPVLLDTPVARESCQDAALYVEKPDAESVGGALERLLADPVLRARLLAAAPAVLARYDGARAADETLAVLESSGRRP